MIRIQKLPESGRFKKLYAKINEIIAAVHSLMPVGGLNSLTDHTAIGVVRKSRAVGEAGKPSKQFALKHVRGDYLMCLPHSGGVIPVANIDDPSLVKIAKPWKLRASTWDGETIEGWAFEVVTTMIHEGIRLHSTRVSDGRKEIDQVVPHYLVNDLIYADQPDGGTAAVDMYNDDAPLIWCDQNRDGRSSRKPMCASTEDGDF